jgi:hypothetical protein
MQRVDYAAIARYGLCCARSEAPIGVTERGRSPPTPRGNMSDKDKPTETKISDLPDKPGTVKDADAVKGGRMNSNPTETGDVTPGPNGGDTG